MAIIIYETFEEISKVLTDGRSIFHVVESKHNDEDCLAWQQGVHDFGKWLDSNGYKVVKTESQAEGE